ncbi:MAG: hypothetical protein ACRDTD_12440, partial [Pseudonocardiaceae bacterium]
RPTYASWTSASPTSSPAAQAEMLPPLRTEPAFQLHAASPEAVVRGAFRLVVDRDPPAEERHPNPLPIQNRSARDLLY